MAKVETSACDAPLNAGLNTPSSGERRSSTLTGSHSKATTYSVPRRVTRSGQSSPPQSSPPKKMGRVASASTPATAVSRTTTTVPERRLLGFSTVPMRSIVPVPLGYGIYPWCFAAQYASAAMLKFTHWSSAPPYVAAAATASPGSGSVATVTPSPTYSSSSTGENSLMSRKRSVPSSRTRWRQTLYRPPVPWAVRYSTTPFRRDTNCSTSAPRRRAATASDAVRGRLTAQEATAVLVAVGDSHIRRRKRPTPYAR